MTGIQSAVVRMNYRRQYFCLVDCSYPLDWGGLKERRPSCYGCWFGVLEEAEWSVCQGWGMGVGVGVRV
jgi:hypothetical protein